MKLSLNFLKLCAMCFVILATCKKTPAENSKVGVATYNPQASSPQRENDSPPKVFLLSIESCLQSKIDQPVSEATGPLKIKGQY